MRKRRHRSDKDSPRKDSYVYRPPQPWYQRALDAATSPAGLGGLTGTFLGLVVAVLAVDVEVRRVEPGVQALHVRLRPGDAAVYQQQGAPAQVESLATIVRIALGGTPIVFGAVGVVIGRYLTPPRVEEVFEQPR